MTLPRRSFLTLGGETATLAALSACGSNGGTSEPSGSAPAGTASGSSNGGGGSTFAGSLSILTPEFAGNTGAAALEGGILDPFFAQTSADYTVDYASWGQLNEKLATSIAGGVINDVIMPGVGWIEPLANMGILAEIPESALDGLTIDPNLLDAVRWDGKLYGLPYFVDGRVAIYNIEMFENAGITVPISNLDDFRAAMLEVKPEGGVGIDLFSYGIRQAWVHLVGCHGGRLFDADGQITFNDGTGLAALEYMAALVADGTANYEVRAIDGQPRPWQRGEAAVDLMNSGAWPALSSQTPDLVTEEKMGMMALPAADGGDPVMFQGGTLLTMSANAEDPDFVVELMRHMLSSEAMDVAIEETGRVPANEDVDPALISENRLTQFTLENFQYATVREGGTPAWMDIRSGIDPELEAVVTGAKSPQQAMDAIEALANDAIGRL